MQSQFLEIQMKKAIKVCDLETTVMPSGAEGSAKIITLVAVPIIIYALA
jgi:hypothetical protein